MDFFTFLSLFGGLALFLYGMSIMGGSLEKASEGRLEKVLEKLTGNVIKGVMLGALVTAAIQSSSATTVIVVGLVNARMLKLRQAIGVIMGANIGTTITAHILRLTSISNDNILMRLLKPTSLAPMVAIIGILLFMVAKSDKLKNVGQMLLGFGILFTGMQQMESAVSPLAELPAFRQMFSTLTNPVVGVVVGAVVTAIIQSSSASVGILQAISSTGLVTWSSAIPLILGQNIGTCITPILAGIGASKNAKRTGVVHLSFNIIGTTVFLVGIYALHAIRPFAFWDDAITSGGIANFHTLFNVGVTLVLIPFTGLLEKLAYTVIPKSPGEDGQAADGMENLLEERLMVSPGLALEHAREAVMDMARLAQKNLHMANGMLVGEYDKKIAQELAENEQRVDRYQDRIEDYLIQLSKRHLTENSKAHVAQLLHIIGDVERIADHAEDITEVRASLAKSGASFSDTAREEIKNITKAVEEIVDTSVMSIESGNPAVARRIEPLEQVIDLIEEQLKDDHIKRLRDGKCGVDAAFTYVEALASLERIADHCSNIGISVISSAGSMENYNSHDYLEALHQGESEEYTQLYQEFYQRYIESYRIQHKAE